ncbi:MAG: hypothetical protein NTU61_00215 [Candidatus Altiarchaeota archaeon]|nr:hypothetical protein [Candidatus Altiarchaeota archaeon]
MIGTRTLAAALVLLLMVSCATAQEYSLLSMMWNKSISGDISKLDILKLYVADIDNDGLYEAVIVTSGNAGTGTTKDRNRVIAYDGSGNVRWDYKVDDVIRESLMYDINNDMSQEFVVASGQTLNNIQRGTIRIIDSRGELLRSYDSTSIMQVLHLTDINEDRYYQLLGGSTLKAILFQTYGERVWTYPAEGKGALSSPATALDSADIDNDKKPEMLVGTDKLYYINNDGSFIGTYDYEPTESSTLKKGFTYLKAFKLSGSEYPDVLVVTKSKTIQAARITKASIGSNEKYYEEINKSWTLEMPADINTIIPTQADEDTFPEFVVGCANNKVYLIDNLGMIKWEYPLNGNVDDMILGDIDEDNITDIVVGTYAGTIYSLDLKGNFKWKQDTTTPILKVGLGDINGDGLDDIVVMKENNILEAYEINKTFVIRKRADNYFHLGQEYMLSMEYEKAIEYFGLAKLTYVNINYEKGVYDCENLTRQAAAQLTENRRKDADVYYSKAQDYFITGDYESALAFAKKAREIYLEFGDSEKVLKCELLELRIKNIINEPVTVTTMDMTVTTLPLQQGLTLDLRILSVVGLAALAVIIIFYIRKRRKSEEELISDGASTKELEMKLAEDG